VSESSAQRKLARGIEHVETLRDEAWTFESANAYVPHIERNIRTPQEIEYQVTATENLRPPEHWPVLAGEAIQNLRSALDHAVYPLVKKNRGLSQFPIFTDPCEFQVKGRPLIAGVPSPIRTLIESRQPYKALPSKPALDSLAVLSSFSNRDKHRTLNTVVTASRLQYIGIKDGVRIEPLKPFREGQPLYHGAHIAHFIARAEKELREVDVDPRFVYEVRIEGRSFVNTLVAIAMRVYECVTECETGQTISPLAQYPISPL
jgi:hypothetical protein